MSVRWASTGSPLTVMLPVVGRVTPAKFAPPEVGSDSHSHSQPSRTIELRHFADESLEAAEYDRSALPVGARISGPAVIREGLATTFVVPGQTAEVGSLGELVIEAV